MSSYFLCGTPRSGSTLLCNLLRDTKHAGWPESFYRKNSVEERAAQFGISHLRGGDFHRAYLASVVKEGRGGSSIFGLRIMWDTFIEMDALLCSAFPNLQNQTQRLKHAFGEVKFVFLFRQDVVRQAVSLLKAKQGGLWHLGADGTPIQQRPNKRPLIYDRKAISELILEMDEHNSAWKSWFQENGISPLLLTYEDLAENPVQELKRVLDYIQVPQMHGIGLQPKTAKLADEINQSWTERYKNERG